MQAFLATIFSKLFVYIAKKSLFLNSSKIALKKEKKGAKKREQACFVATDKQLYLN